MSNPLNTLLRTPRPDGPHYRWGYVTSVSPTLQVVLDTETDPIQKPSTLVTLEVGDRVFVLMESLRATVLGKVPEPPVPEPAWQSWTPVIKGTTTDPTMGNSTLVGRYLQVGKTVSLRLYLEIGSTFNPGAGVYMIPTLPVAPRTDYWQPLLVSANLASPAVGDYAGVAKIEGSAGIVRIHVYRGGTTVSLGAVGADNFVTGNRLMISGTYEAA